MKWLKSREPNVSFYIQPKIPKIWISALSSHALTNVKDPRRNPKLPIIISVRHPSKPGI
jgi:hypothetical protein